MKDLFIDFLLISVGEGWKSLIVGSLPTGFLPSKSIESLKAVPRCPLVRGTCEQEIPVASMANSIGNRAVSFDRFPKRQRDTIYNIFG